MTKFSIEEKRKAVERVNEGSSIKQVARETGISEQGIRNVLNHVEGHSWEALTQHRYDRTADEKLAVMRCMEANHWSYAETSVQYGIKGSSTVWNWADRYQRYGMAGLEG
ncbi:MAG: transposase, partial [Chloroflexi bacterium]|nr:transposase [Chloroflexota bacterium]